MRIRLAIPDKHVTPEVLEAALEATSLANEQLVRSGEVPPIEQAIANGLRWRPEPFTDGEHFDLATMHKRGWMDCDDLAPWLAGEMRAHGIDARARVYKSGKDRWHVVVEDQDGRILDPSRWAGMGSGKPPGVVGMLDKPMAHDGEGSMCVVPRGGKYWARCDLPWPDAMGHLASTARAAHPDTALDRAVAGAMACGAEIDSHLLDRCGEIGELLLGAPGEYPEQIGSLFGGLKKLGKLAASAAIPGGGAAMSALSMLHKGKGKKPPGAHEHHDGAVSAPVEHAHGKPSMIYFHPKGDGPVIVRF